MAELVELELVGSDSNRETVALRDGNFRRNRASGRAFASSLNPAPWAAFRSTWYSVLLPHPWGHACDWYPGLGVYFVPHPITSHSLSAQV